jgi:hypothetical protein
VVAIGGLFVLWLAGFLYPVYRYFSSSVEKSLLGKAGKLKVDKITFADVAWLG